MRLLAGQIALEHAPIPARSQCRILGLKNPLHRIQKKLYQVSPNYVDEVRRDVARLPSLGAKLDYLMRNRQFRVDQQKPEFLQLLNMVRELAPKRLVEIGGRRGGSSLLFSTASGDNCDIVTIDLGNKGSRAKRLMSLCRDRQIQFWQGDSHAQETHARLAQYLKGSALDFLFIDGDHSYEGAKQDFENYSKLVRPGGLIALHDIQPEFATAYGVQTASWTGGVPKLWQELVADGLETTALISEPHQDGYGIGVIHWAGSKA